MPWPFTKKKQEQTSAYFGSKVPLVSYWLYFNDEAAAREAAERVRAEGLLADAFLSAHDKRTWVGLAYKPLPDNEADIEAGARVARAVASSLRGEYDGWEAGPLPDPEMMVKVQAWLESGVGAPDARPAKVS